MNIQKFERGSVLLCALCTILVISLIGANVLVNCTTRYNVTSKQVKAWKEALIAAEAGGDVGYAECRKMIGDPNVANTFNLDGWAVPSPAPANPTWTKSVAAFGVNGTLSSQVTVDVIPPANINPTTASMNNYYRIRAIGTAKVLGLRRTGMDDRMGLTTRGDSLLRKIDFNYDHFKAAYGDGDGNGAAITPVPAPQITRRIELIATPVDPFEGAIKAVDSFQGPGPASLIDSYDSRNTPPPGVSPSPPAGSNYYFAATNPSDPHYADSRNGNIAVNAPNFSDLQSAPIYGSVGTNGGNVTHAAFPSIYGTIDNSISFDVVSIKAPPQPPLPYYQSGQPSTIAGSATSTNPLTPDWYFYPGGITNGNYTINSYIYTDPVTNATKTMETYVTIYTTGDFSPNQITIGAGVTAKIYFTGNYSLKASKTDNNNVDGAPGIYQANGTASDNLSRAGHLQFYGINPPDGQTQTITTNPGGAGGQGAAQLWAVFYAPGADFTMNGNPDLFGAVVCKTFSGNGNTGFHYDKQLKWLTGPPVDYRIASYVEDIR